MDNYKPNLIFKDFPQYFGLKEKEPLSLYYNISLLAG